MDYSHSTDKYTYQAIFSLYERQCPSDVIFLLDEPHFENEITIVRFPEEGLSIDDPEDEMLFYETGNKWRVRCP